MNFLPPRCPDCQSPMIFINEDMTSQGGPPEDTWLCDKPDHSCGKVLGSYRPPEGEGECRDSRDEVPLDPEAAEAFWAQVIEYGFYHYSSFTAWEEVEAQATRYGRRVSRDNLGWGTEACRFMVLPEGLG